MFELAKWWIEKAQEFVAAVDYFAWHNGWAP